MTWTQFAELANGTYCRHARAFFRDRRSSSSLGSTAIEIAHPGFEKTKEVPAEFDMELRLCEVLSSEGRNMVAIAKV